MTDEKGTREKDEALYQLYRDAVDLTDNKITYINNVHVSYSATEIVVDLYFLAPDHRKAEPDNQPTQARLVHRVAFPISVAKRFGEILDGVVAQWEQSLGASAQQSGSEDNPDANR